MTSATAPWRGAVPIHAVAIVMGLTCGFSVVAAPTELILSLLLTAGLALGTVVVMSQREDADSYVRNMFALAFVLRLALALVLHYLVRDRALFAGDDVGYERIGLLQAANWETGVTMAGGHYAPRVPYDYWNAALFFVFGPHTLLPKALNALIGALAVFPIHRLAKNVFDDKETARLAALLYAVAPSMVLWSSMNLRDPIAILAILLLVDTAVALRIRPTVLRALWMVPLFALLGAVRAYMVLVVGLGLGLALVVVRSKHVTRDFLVGMIAALALLFVVQYLGFGKTFVSDASLERMNTMREGLRAGGSALSKEDISTPLGALATLPQGLLYLLFAPFPWQLSSIRQLFSMPEVLLFYGFFPFIAKGIRDALRTRTSPTLPALGVTVTVLVAYALVSGNLGTAYRHKAQVLSFLIVFGAGGYVKWRRQRRGAAGMQDPAGLLAAQRA